MKKILQTITGILVITLVFTSISFAGLVSTLRFDLVTKGYLNVNTAQVEEIQRLPGFDRQTAENIVNFRGVNGNFSAINELLNVMGIDERKLSRTHPYLRFEGNSTLRTDIELRRPVRDTSK